MKALIGVSDPDLAKQLERIGRGSALLSNYQRQVRLRMAEQTAQQKQPLLGTKEVVEMDLRAVQVARERVLHIAGYHAGPARRKKKRKAFAVF